ncbi:MAG: hypothetical protein JWR61_1880 [Ferruginibacter sp.]|nr:hypothetical protein [Ferruginibacter sp.]
MFLHITAEKPYIANYTLDNFPFINKKFTTDRYQFILT